MKIGFIGVGNMGKHMAANLLKAGFDVSVFDIVESAVNEMAKLGATPCKSNLELAASVDYIFTSLPNAAIVENVMNGPDGVFKACREGTTIIDMSSVGPSTTQKMAGLAAKKGIKYVDAPVSGGVYGAQEGTLTIMVGADEETFTQLLPIFNVIGKNIYNMGGTGLGNAIKIINNLLLGCNMAALAEALVLGVKCGLNAQIMYDIIKVSSGNSYVLDKKMPKFILTGDYTGGFSTDLQYKDLGLALEAGKTVGTPLPVTAIAVQVFEAARAKGLGKQDMSSIVKVWEDLCGATVCN